MVKKYGGYTGNPTAVDPAKTGAPGAWQAPSEVAREIGLDAWPGEFSPSVFVFNNTAEYTYAVTSGAAFDALSSGTYLIPSGQEVSRSTYSTLFNVLSSDYGSGNGSTTFNLPNLESPYIYIKPSIPASGLTASTASGVARLPYHTHTFLEPVSIASTGAPAGGGAARLAGASSVTSHIQGRYDGNRGSTMEMVPLIALENVRAPAGIVAPVLVPEINNIATVLPSNCVVCSGQALNRTTYAHLYSKIGNTFGQGDGATTFNVPDLRGLFVSSPYYNLLQPSGHSQPSGFVPHNFASHQHRVLGPDPFDFSAPVGGTFRRLGMVPPDSSISSLGSAQESRPDNLTCVWIMVVN